MIKFFIVSIVSMCLSSFCLAQDAKTQEIMKKMQEAATPGEPHKILTDLAGEWTFTSKGWESAKSKPHESKGTSTIKAVLGGRFIQQEVKSEMMGIAYEGMGIMGYDNVKKEYNTVWTDSFGTGMLRGEGKFDIKTKTLKEEGEYSCPITKKDRDYRSELKIIDQNNMIFSMYSEPIEGGKEFKQMEMVYKRIK